MNSSIQSLRRVEPWTLEQDSQLCSIFENLLRHVQTRSQDLQGRLVNINQNISSLDATVECINGRLDLLASRQFVEHRIVEENLTRPSPSPEMSRHTPATPSHDDTRNSLRDAIRHGVNFLAASGLGNEELRQPNLIGSAEFYTSVLPEMAEKVVDNPIPQIPQPIDCGIPPPPVPPQQIPLQIPEPEFSDQEPIASAGILATTATVIQPAPLAVIPVVPVIPAKPVLPKPTVTPARKGGLFDSDDSDEEDIFAQAKKRVATKSESPFDSSLSKKSTVSSIRFLEEEAEPEEFHQDKPSQPEKPKNAFAPSLADVLSATSSLRNKSIDDQSPTVRPPGPAPKLLEGPPSVRSERTEPEKQEEKPSTSKPIVQQTVVQPEKVEPKRAVIAEKPKLIAQVEAPKKEEAVRKMPEIQKATESSSSKAISRSISQPAKKSLFDSDDSDDDLFSAAARKISQRAPPPQKSAQKIVTERAVEPVADIPAVRQENRVQSQAESSGARAEAPKPQPQPLTRQKKTTKGLFDSDSDDDLFAAIKYHIDQYNTQPPPKQQTEQPKKEPEQSAASGGRLLPVKAYIGTSERPEKKSTPAQITHKKSLFDDSDSDSELYKKPTKPEPKKGDHPKQEPQNTAPETTQQSIVQPTVSPVKVEEKKEQTVEELKDSIRTLLKENEEADRELIRDIISPEIARKGEKEETSDSPKSPQKSTVSTDTVENKGKPEEKPDPVSEASAAETEGKAVEPEVESSPEYTSEHPQKSEPGTTVIPEVQDTFKVSPPPFEPQESNPEPIEQNPAVPEKSEESTVAPPRIEEKLEEPSTRPVFEPEPEAPPIFEPSEAPPLFTVPLDTVESTVSPPPFEEELEKPPAPPVFEPEPEAPPPFPKSRSPPATVAKPVEADLEVPPPFLGNREEEALEAPPPFRFEPEEREELPFGPPSFAPAAEEPDFPLPIPSDHLLYSPPPFDIDRLSRKEEEKQVEFPAEKDEKEDQPLPTTTLDDTEEMSGARGKLNNSAFASKLSAALAMPPGGPRPPGAPSSSTSSPASSSSAAPLRRAASEQPPRSPESRLFDEKPSLLSSMAKGRPKGPPRRPPTTRNRLSQDINSSRPISVTSSRASSTDQKEESAPIFRRNPSLIQTRATKSMVLPSSPIKSDEVVIERKLSNTRISEGGSASGRKSSTSSSRSSLHGGDEDKKGVTAVQNSPPIVRKGSTGSRISITSQTVKSHDTKEPTQPKKKSLFDSESSDDDLFRGKAASTAKTAPKKASVITTTVTKDNTKPPAGPSSTSTTSRPPAPKTTSTAPKKSLFDDSDDDLDLFRKKK